MRVLVINYEFPPLGGGAGNATACLTREWAASGHEVEIVTGGFRGLPAREIVGGCLVRRLSSPRRRQGQCSVVEMMVFSMLACLAAFRVKKPDVAVAFFSIPSGPAAWLLNKIRGVPYVVSLRGGDVPGFDKHNMATMHALTNPVTTMIWRSAAAVVGNSGGLCQLARNFMPDLDVPEIPNGVDAARFSPREPAAAERQKPVTLLFVGRLNAQKGVGDLLNALALLPPGWRLRVVGDGPDRVALERQSAQLGIAEHVIFHGWAQRDELPAIYNAADIFVFPSHDEGMSNAVLEALASGLPVVATRIAGNEQLVREGENGALVPPANPRAFANALAPFLTDTTLRLRMGNASRALAVAQFSWATAAAQYDALFQKIVTSH